MVLTKCYKRILYALNGFMADMKNNNNILAYSEFIHRIDLLTPCKFNSTWYDSVYTQFKFNSSQIAVLPWGLGLPSSQVANPKIFNPQSINSSWGYTTSSIEGNPYIMLGTGTTAPTENDIALENAIDTVATLSCSRFETIDNGMLIGDSNLVITNNDSQDLTFQEIGMFAPLALGGNCSTSYNGSPISGSGSYSLWMLWRHVFDSPITIEQGESKTIVITGQRQLGSSTDYPNIAKHICY